MELVKTQESITEKERSILTLLAESSADMAGDLIEQFFSSTDDLFYELSDRASTNNEENFYFEAMRAIRVSRKSVEKAFIASIKDSFFKIPELRQESEPQDDSELSIVQRDELEIELAQKNMADRTRDTYKQELFDLVARFNALLSNLDIDDRNNPLDPIQLSRSFVAASMQHLQLDIKARLIFYKLFEKHFLKQLGHLYADANKLLIDEGILPKVGRQVKKEQDDSNTENTTAIKEQEKRASETSLFESFGEQTLKTPFQLEESALSALMSSIRSARQSNVESAQTLGDYHYFSNNPGVLMPLPELANLLTDTQQTLDEKLSTEEPQNIVPQIVTDILSQKDPEKPQALEQSDEDIINLVALFFDKVLEDENLPIALQSLICRLQIPVLKVALNDKTFLTDENHPARLLINCITRAGLSFDESKPIERDPLFKTLSEGVHSINKTFNLDHDIFLRVIESVEHKIKAEKKRSEAVESRTQQTETGKAKLSAARTHSQNALYDKIKDIELPLVISEFLTNSWLQVMVLTYVRSGNDSDEWVENEQIIGDVVWASQSYMDEKSKLRQERIIPELVEKISEKLGSIIESESERDSKLLSIKTTLEIACESKPESKPENLDYGPLSAESKTRLGKENAEEKSWDEMTALERQNAQYEELSEQFYTEAKNLQIGTWMEYSEQAKGKNLRCKLSAKIDAENYIFVNRLGFKTLSKTRRQFAYDMQFNKVKLLDNTPLFERLMNKVVTQLKTISNEM